MNISEQKQISVTILKQLGEQQFISMVGARDIMYDDSGSLMLKFKGSKK